MIEVKNFSKTYANGKKAVDDISFEVRDGEIFGFLGPNGAGKSTTIKSLVGINSKSRGEITINGISLEEDPLTYKRQFSYVPDNPDLFENYSGKEYINFVADIYGIDSQTYRRKCNYCKPWMLLSNPWPKPNLLPFSKEKIQKRLFRCLGQISLPT